MSAPAGRLQQVTSPGGLSEAYEYHSTNGAVNEITRSIGASSYELDFGFDTHGRLTQIQYPTNADAQRLAVDYVFDAWGVLSQVRNTATPSLVYYTLNAQAGSGAVRRATLQNLAYDWDLAGNLEQRVDQLLSRTEVFNYDALDRLTGVVRNSATILSAGYNAVGNITSKTGVSGTYTYGSSRPHAVTGIGSMSFGYDTNGNMTNRSGTSVTWTSYNLPLRIQRSSGEYSEFLYGADRSRYRQIEGAGALSSTRHYASPGLFEVLTWNGGASRVDYHYIHANGRAVAQFTASTVETDTLQYLHRDHQGSVVATTATGGTVLNRFEYDAFGARTTTVGSDARSHRGYTGHEHLKALDLIHMNGRVQDPVLGRFLSPDPFVQAPYHSQSLNRYSYVWNNPMTLVDPSGFQADICYDATPSHGSYFDGDPALFGGPSMEQILRQCGLDDSGPRNYDSSNQGGGSGTLYNVPVPQGDSRLPEIIPGSGGGSSTGLRDLAAGFEAAHAQSMADLQHELYLSALARQGNEAAASELAAIRREEMQQLLNFVPMGGVTKGVTHLYQKVSATGEHLKFGITNNPLTRYTANELAGGRLRVIASGAREDMLALERKLHERLPIGREEAQKIYIKIQEALGLRPPPYQ